jgi:glycine/D-amino acid oxidase-like deaminating enzyme
LNRHQRDLLNSIIGGICMVLDKADVVVIGGGIVGTSSAYFLKKAGFDVVLVEQRELAYGASGRNAGFLWIHNRNKGIQLDLSRAGAKIYEEEYVPMLGNTFEYRRNGGMIYFYTEEQKRVFEEFVESRNRDGVPMDLIDGETARSYAPILPENVLGSTYCPEDGQIRTPKLVRALGNACNHLGVRIYENNAVLGMITNGDKIVGVRTVMGEIHAEKVVIASGVWSKVLGQTLNIDIPVHPERLGVIRTTPVPKVLDKVVYGPQAAKQYADIRNLPSFKDEYFLDKNEDPEAGVENLELLAQLEDGSLLIGCPMDYPNSLDMYPTLGGLKLTIDTFLSQFPSFKGVGVDAVWAGLLPYTADALPIIDEVEEYKGLYVAAGHVFGNLAGPITGKLISELISGKEKSLPLDELKLKRDSLISRDLITRW